MAWDGGPMPGDGVVTPARSRSRPGLPGPAGPANEISAVGGASGGYVGAGHPREDPGTGAAEIGPSETPKLSTSSVLGGVPEAATATRDGRSRRGRPVPACSGPRVFLRVAPGLARVGAGGHGGSFGQ